MPTQERVYKPIFRTLFDFILTVDLALFILVALNLLNGGLAVFVGGAVNSLQVVCWYMFAHKIFVVKMDEQSVSGPSRGLKRIEIPRLELDRKSLRIPLKESKVLGYRDIQSKDERILRLWSRFLGRSQVESILYHLIGAKSVFK